MTIVEARNFGVTIGSNAVLRGVNLEVKRNEILGIILHHANFFKHDLFLFFNFLLAQARVQEQVREKIQSLGQMLIENLDIEGRRLSRGKRVHFSAECVNFTRDVRCRP